MSSSEDSVETKAATAMNDDAPKDLADAEVAEAVVAIEEMVADPGNVRIPADDAVELPEVGEETGSPPRAASADSDDEDDDDIDFEEDGRADKALDFVVEVLSKMQMDCTVDLMENDVNDPPSDIRIEISGKDASRLIGKKGQTLAALQFLTNRVVNRPSLPRRHILIDADGYRSRRETALSTMAQRLGQQAVDEGKIITFEPMSAQDRRVVHLALAKFPGVVTKSEGKGATRRVQIIPVRE